MKGIDLFCASPASTAICVSMEKSSVVLQGGRAIDRHNYPLRDARRSTRGLLNPSSSSSSSSHSQSQPPTNSKAYPKNQNQKKTDKKRSAKATNLITPPGSSRYLLGESSFLEVYSDFDPIPAWIPSEPSRPLSLNLDDSPALKPPSSSSSSSITSSSLTLKPSSSSTPSLPSPALIPSSSSTHSRHQVVVLRVSLHCKGCAGKVRKHISRMEGVTSFSIDFATKKVTVIGDVTPLDVLASISRVKNAQFWPSPSPAPVPLLVGSTSGQNRGRTIM
ncbi:protein SODIUM POTASSIUM ROOT DEFECTIVE 1-like [Telopea speciosissima]|uniref:protein SODIUM POTASSIUM ROOT DEFECTIVE 1-like n=1 Tax=Telopea speciosissima TaxID=54955 RepID=UPI001CC3F76C|nr:protein SODIUM POTASSIUM ROOT DEFECTIVE 1-like [Telopea speciosissima]